MLRYPCLQMLLVGALLLTGYTQSNSQGIERGRGETPPYVPNSIPNRDQGVSERSSNDVSRNVDPVIQAVQINVAEIEAGKMGARKAQNPRVKEFGNMMVKDHTAALAKLRTLPGGESSRVKPDGKHRDAAKRLAQLSGADFDREYIAAMVSDHEEALMFFERYSHGQVEPTNQTGSKGGTTQAGEPGKEPKADAHAPSGAEYNPEFTKVATDLVPAVRQHLQLAQQIQQELQSGSLKPERKTDNPVPADNRNNRN